ncbi:MAG: bifunctional precorrin-2 dehydrogenase/sirohydrochlorin ferrochelatase [Bacteroidales bacterium]|nr:bifunctional precorrin-2 dehydrogenase/sirohydrochlorin ferrochelatase [Bacteroidales bacterium]MBP5134559.1 bifunctional precorrin-2 dehydrogenase/sirohydrochlorin ferrochelatase [Paludibacteraceae bacterium]
MDFLPIGIRISNARILIVGGGRVATHKALILNRFTNRVTVVAPDISADIRNLPFQCIERCFQPSDLEGVTLLYICTNNRQLNRSIREAAEREGVLVNVCDSPSECDFVSPAVFGSGSLTISVASDAKDVKRSIRVRNNIKEAIENGSLRID